MKKIILAVAVGSALASSAAVADEAELKAEIQQLRQLLDAQGAQLKAQGALLTQLLHAQADVPSDPQQKAIIALPAVPADSVPSPPLAATSAAPPLPEASPGTPATTFFGYGELNYQNYPHDHAQTQADLARAVIGMGHAFDDKTRFAAEFEWEHAVTSDTDQGESEVEQFYVERSFTPQLAGRAGLFLIPSGMLNTAHEPTQYFGVTRNFVETAIIPTTWREGGIGVTGITDFDLTWDVGVTTGFNLAKWDPTSVEGKASPLASIHQELQLAKASDLSAFGALNWRGYPGLLVGGSVFSGKAGQDQPDFPSQQAVVTLAEGHVRWTPGPFDLSALYARGHISDTAPYNQTIVTLTNPTLVPQDFYGWYGQAAWYAWQKGDYQLAPFVRYERFNTGWKYATLATGLTPGSLPNEGVTTLGASFYLTPNIVVKADYQWFSVDSQSNRFELGLGLNY
jgi:opacity protein-like surface antigen